MNMQKNNNEYTCPTNLNETIPGVFCPFGLIILLTFKYLINNRKLVCLAQQSVNNLLHRYFAALSSIKKMLKPDFSIL